MKDSDSVSPGSNPGSPANNPQHSQALEPSDTADKPERNAYARRTETGTIVYFVKCDAHVKIGVSTIWCMRRRLSDLQTGNPVKLEILGVVEGDVTKEEKLHHVFAEHRGIGEWFRLVDEIADFIADNARPFEEVEEKYRTVSSDEFNEALRKLLRP